MPRDKKDAYVGLGERSVDFGLPVATVLAASIIPDVEGPLTFSHPEMADHVILPGIFILMTIANEDRRSIAHRG